MEILEKYQYSLVNGQWKIFWWLFETLACSLLDQKSMILRLGFCGHSLYCYLEALLVSYFFAYCCVYFPSSILHLHVFECDQMSSIHIFCGVVDVKDVFVDSFFCIVKD